MPDPTLESILLQKATSIGPVHHASIAPARNMKPMDAPMEGQVPDPIAMITKVLGDPLANSSPATPAVSIFANKAARELATQRFLDTAGDLNGTYRAVNTPEKGALLSDLDSKIQAGISRAAGNFADRYPRIAAHMRLVQSNPGVDYTAAANVFDTPSGRPPERAMEVTFNPRYNMDATMSPTKFSQTLAHEATHVAQRLGNSNMQELYNAANKIGGWEGNPFEKSAVSTESSYIGNPRATIDIPSPEVQKWQKSFNDSKNQPWEHRGLIQDILNRVTKENPPKNVPYTTLRGLQQMVEQGIDPLEPARATQKKMALHTIQDILLERARRAKP